MFISDGHHSKSEFPGSALQKLEPPPCFQAVLTGIHFVFQGVHHMADSRLRIAKLLGGFCQTAGFCDLNESAIF